MQETEFSAQNNFSVFSTLKKDSIFGILFSFSRIYWLFFWFVINYYTTDFSLEVYVVKSYEIMFKVNGSIQRKVVDADTKAKAQKQIKDLFPSEKVEFLMVKQVV